MSRQENSGSTVIGATEPNTRLNFSGLFRLASTVFVVAVLFFTFFLTTNGLYPNSLLFYLFCYSLGGLSVALVSGGIVDMVIHGGYTLDRSGAQKICSGVIAGFALAFLSAPYPFSGSSGLSYTGFPLPFSETCCVIGSSFTSENPIAFLIDCAFWISLAFPAVWFAGSVIGKKLRAMGRLEGVGAAAFLTYGIFPGWGALLALGFLNSILASIGPLFTLSFFFLPSAVVGTLSAVRGNKTLGFTIVLASLLLVSLAGLAILTYSLHVVL